MRRVALAAAALAAVVAVGWSRVLPRWVEHRLRAGFAARAGAPVHLALVRLAPDRVEVADLAVGGGDPALRARRVVATFSVADLVAGRIATLRVEGAVWDRSRPWPMRGAGTEKGGAWGGSPLPDLPFRHAAFADARIVDGGVVDVEIDADFAAEPGRWRANVAGTAWNEPFAADIDLIDGGDGRASGPVEIRGGADGMLLLRGTAALSGDSARTLAIDLRASGPFALGGGAVSATGDGTLALGAEVPFAAPGEGRATLAFADVVLRLGERVHVGGLQGALRLAALAPPRSAEPGELRWDALAVGDLAAAGGTLRFALLPGPTLRVDELRCALDAEGTLRASPFEVAPGTTSVRTVLAVERAPLDPWLQLLCGGRVTGSGRLSGEVEVAFRPGGEPAFELPRGSLRADGGVLRVLDAAAAELVRQHARAAVESAGKDVQDAVEDRIVGTLEEFAFDELRFELVPSAGEGEGAAGTTLQVRVSGRGVRVAQELVLALDFAGFDAALASVLAAQARLRERTGRSPPKSRS
ncbi:MAG TPA: hypothetical protein VK081_07805 [Planctomycetota bacterium]|nr:hypothetical protein [Planctomycetota bacterium]